MLKTKKKKFEFRVTETDCWECTSHKKDKSGYTMIVLDGVGEYLHRRAYRKYKGDIPNNMLVRHICDNPLCFNPSHLLLGTNQDNANDKVERNRVPNGTNHCKSIFTEEQVLYIRSSGKRACVLSKEMNTPPHAIQDILRRKTWKHI